MSVFSINRLFLRLRNTMQSDIDGFQSQVYGICKELYMYLQVDAGKEAECDFFQPLVSSHVIGLVYCWYWCWYRCWRNRNDGQWLGPCEIYLPFLLCILNCNASILVSWILIWLQNTGIWELYMNLLTKLMSVGNGLNMEAYSLT